MKYIGSFIKYCSPIFIFNDDNRKKILRFNKFIYIPISEEMQLVMLLYSMQ